MQQEAGTQAPPQNAPAPAPAPAAASAGDASGRISQLKQLADLHSSGALTDEEFASEKAKILG
jgi:Short C-terminal domain